MKNPPSRILIIVLTSKVAFFLSLGKISAANNNKNIKKNNKSDKLPPLVLDYLLDPSNVYPFINDKK